MEVDVRRAARGGSGTHATYTPPVREAAVVYVNGQRAGAAWCPPYQVELTGLLKPGVNEIKVVVGNLATNPGARAAALREGAVPALVSLLYGRNGAIVPAVKALGGEAVAIQVSLGGG